MRKKCVFRGQVVDYHRTVHMQLWPFYFRSTQCNEGDHSELLQPLCNTQMAVCLPQHTVPTMHLGLPPIWISLMRRPPPRLMKNKVIFFFFYRGKKREPFWRSLLLNQSTTSRLKQKRCMLEACAAPTHARALSQHNPVFFSYDTISRQPWPQNPAVVAARQVITSSFTLGFAQEGWGCLLWLRDVLPQQRRRRSICRVIKPLQYWIISTPGQLAGAWIFHGEFGLHKRCNKQIHCHICGDRLYIVVWLQKEGKRLDWRWLWETMQICNPAG